MKCKRHQESEVVSTCQKCGVGICSKCVDATKELADDYGTLCVSCYQKELGNAASYFREDNSKKLTNIIISACLYVLGVIFALINGTGDQVISIIVGIFFCGFYNAIAGWKKGEDMHDEHERKHGVTYNVTSEGNIERDDGFFKKLLVAAIYTVLGIVVTPFNIIKNSIAIAQNKKGIADLEAEIENVEKI